MAELPPTPPPPLVSATTDADHPPPPPSQRPPFVSFPKWPGIRVSKELKNHSSVYLNNISCKFFDGLSKLDLSLKKNDPHLNFASKYLTLHCDFELPPPPPQNPYPNPLVSATTPADPLPPPPPRRAFSLPHPKWPGIRFTTEFDSYSTVYRNKISSKFLDNRGKLKFSFSINDLGTILHPQVTLCSKYLTLHYDLLSQKTLVSVNVGSGLQLKASHNVKARANKTEVAVVADLAGPAYKCHLSSRVPPAGLPRATFKFPVGEISFEKRKGKRLRKTLSVNGYVKGNLLNGIQTAQFSEKSLNLRSLYKVKQLAFISSISLPSKDLSLALKTRFGPFEKLSCWYNFDSNYWITTYKHTIGKDYKFKVCYDGENGLGWVSLCVGDEGGKAKTAPMKMIAEFMLEAPTDDFKSAAVCFTVKKRWDI